MVKIITTFQKWGQWHNHFTSLCICHVSKWWN